MRGFKVYAIDTATGPVQPSSRRDLFTIYLLTGPHHLHRADQEIVQAGTRLCLGAPPPVSTPATVATRQTGYCCLFTEAFVSECEDAARPEAVPRALLDYKGTCSYLVPDEEAAYLTVLFERMLREQQTTYVFKQALVRSYLHLVLHEAMRLHRPAPKRYFRYYCRQPGVPGGLDSGWRRRQLHKR
jgi:AraC family transcriptional activator of pobA